MITGSIMFLLAIVAWIGGVVVSFYNGNRGLPLTILVLGIPLLILSFTGRGGPVCIAGIAVLTVIIWIANKADM